MPTYDYRCERCDARFEMWQSFSENSLVTCPTAGGPTECVAPGKGPVKKVFSKVGIAFKGDGFYKNDHGANAKTRSDGDKADKSKDSGSGESKSDKSSSESSSSSKGSESSSSSKGSESSSSSKGSESSSKAKSGSSTD